MSNIYLFRIAVVADAEPIDQLENLACRGEPSLAGWTAEVDMLASF